MQYLSKQLNRESTMSGGKKLTDRHFFGGDGGMPPMSSKVTKMSDAAGDGHEAYYEDTAAAIEKVQNMGVSKAKGHQVKDGFRH